MGNLKEKGFIPAHSWGYSLHGRETEAWRSIILCPQSEVNARKASKLSDCCLHFIQLRFPAQRTVPLTIKMNFSLSSNTTRRVLHRLTQKPVSKVILVYSFTWAITRGKIESKDPNTLGNKCKKWAQKISHKISTFCFHQCHKCTFMMQRLMH